MTNREIKITLVFDEASLNEMLEICYFGGDNQPPTVQSLTTAQFKELKTILKGYCTQFCRRDCGWIC